MLFGGKTKEDNQSFDQSPEKFTFGNTTYYNLFVNDSLNHEGRCIKVLELKNSWTLIQIDDTSHWLNVAKRTLPVEAKGLKFFIADQVNVKGMTTDAHVHNLLNKDVLIGVSNTQLLDDRQFTFPISRKDGFEWELAEDSHMFAFLGLNTWVGPNYFRSHEGIDINMHEARGKDIHPLVAIEDGTVVIAADSSVTKTRDGCIILKSESMENIYYVYKHTNPPTHRVKVGDKVKKGQFLSYIWGDNRWGHLHFAIVYRTEDPTYSDRYTNVINTFPQLYELYFGDLQSRKKVRTKGEFTFGHRYWTVKNLLRRDRFDEKVGYGWELGDWCGSQKVEYVNDRNKEGGNVRLLKVLYKDQPAECTNPNDYYKFNVIVENGTYLVSAVVGDLELPTSQKVFVEDQFLADYQLDAGVYKHTGNREVVVDDGQFTLRLELRDDKTPAGISQLNFSRLSGK